MSKILTLEKLEADTFCLINDFIIKIVADYFRIFVNLTNK